MRRRTLMKAKITIEFDGQNVKVSLPEDPVLCLGLLEVAKIKIQKKLMGLENKSPDQIIVPHFPMGRPS